MAELTGDEPDLELGASGEGVMLLQVRLYALGIYRQVPDGTYDMLTENAVRELQSQLGLDNDGEVHRETWEALLHQETQAGIQYQYYSPYDALAQIVYDREHGAGNADGADEVVSEDGQWRWDGEQWQAIDGGGAGDTATGVRSGQIGELSPDGQWRWDGQDWQPAGQDGADDAVGQLSPDGQWRWTGGEWVEAAPAGTDYTGLLSDDGQWRWDGSRWQAV